MADHAQLEELARAYLNAARNSAATAQSRRKRRRAAVRRSTRQPGEPAEEGDGE
nr:hypothetical protein [Kibdelosporangium sp. MJ126-NF4]